MTRAAEGAPGRGSPPLAALGAVGPFRSRRSIHLVNRRRRKVVERTKALITGRRPHQPWPEGPADEADRGDKAPEEQADRDKALREQAKATRRAIAERLRRHFP